jgi:hypothetical protein
VGHGSMLARDFMRRLCVANRFEIVSCVTSGESQGQRYGYASGGRVLRVVTDLPEIFADTKVRPTKKAAPAAVALSEKARFFRLPRSSKLGGTGGRQPASAAWAFFGCFSRSSKLGVTGGWLAFFQGSELPLAGLVLEMRPEPGPLPPQIPAGRHLLAQAAHVAFPALENFALIEDDVFEGAPDRAMTPDRPSNSAFVMWGNSSAWGWKGRRLSDMIGLAGG